MIEKELVFQDNVEIYVSTDKESQYSDKFEFNENGELLQIHKIKKTFIENLNHFQKTEAIKFKKITKHDKNIYYNFGVNIDYENGRCERSVELTLDKFEGYSDISKLSFIFLNRKFKEYYYITNCNCILINNNTITINSNFVYPINLDSIKMLNTFLIIGPKENEYYLGKDKINFLIKTYNKFISKIKIKKNKTLWRIGQPYKNYGII